MATRLIPIAVLVIGLGAAIYYSQMRPVPNRVSGFLEADEIRLGSRVGGRVAKVHAEEGQQVQAGDQLIELEPFDLFEREKGAAWTLAKHESEYQRLSKGLRPEEVAQARARYDQLLAKLDQLEAGARKQEIVAASARVVAAEAERKLAQQLYERHATLIQSNAIPQDELDRTRQALDSAVAMLSVRENELELLKIGAREEEKRAAQAAAEEAKQAWQMAASGFRQEEINSAKAARDAAQAGLDAIRRQMEELVIRSPLDGIVDSLDLLPGDIVAASAPVAAIIDHRRLWVRAYVPQNRVALSTGQTVRVTVDSFPNQEFFGTVTFIAHHAEFTPSNIQTPEEREKQVFRIKVSLRDRVEGLRPGMSADVWLDTVGEPK